MQFSIALATRVFAPVGAAVYVYVSVPAKKHAAAIIQNNICRVAFSF